MAPFEGFITLNKLYASFVRPNQQEILAKSDTKVTQNLDPATLPNATFARRITAGVYDSLLLFAVAFLYGLTVILIANALGYDTSSGLTLVEAGEDMTLKDSGNFHLPVSGSLFGLGLYLSLAAFYAGFWRTRNATLGMQTWRMVLIDNQGHAPSWKQLIIRVLAGTLSLFCFGIGFLYSLIDPQNRTLHDIVSGTRVVVIPNNK